MTQPQNENEPAEQAPPPAWPTPAAPTSPAAPSDPAAPPADSVPGWPTPASSPAADPAPASPPPWPPPAGSPAPAWPAPGGEQQAGYQAPVDPFHATTNTPASAQLPGADSSSPYTAPTYYPTGQAPVPPAPGTPGAPGAPVSGTPYPYGAYPGYAPGAPVAPPRKKHKGLIITAVVLGVLLVLCLVGAAGAFFLLNNNEGKGKDTARAAAQEFLTAIYKDGNATTAEKLVCKEARDAKEIGDKVKQIKDQGAKLKNPSYSWDSIKIANETQTAAETTVVVKLSTSDEKLSEQTLKLMLVKRDGWFVCDVKEQRK